MTRRRVPNNTNSSRDSLHQQTGSNNLGLSLLLIVFSVIHLLTGSKPHLGSPWEWKACKNFGKNTKRTLHFMDMSITAKEHNRFIRSRLQQPAAASHSSTEHRRLMPYRQFHDT
ncbi:hypothetical protein Q3G72_012917 [Acer saccharum]|nr:hypothetical protein Q3G72_012917 [Acer saccharum]